ncbi:MAG: hypothetical protein ABJZ55_20600 [Fuerstiella sp.]
MKRFRYEAVDSSGTPLFGVQQCDHLEELIRILESRGQELKKHTELSLEEFNRKQSKLIPRLVQLRVGERIHDALLTGLPAHEAVRAVASEPVQAPLLFAMPWVYFLATLALTLVWAAISFGYVSAVIGFALFALIGVLLPIVHLALRELLYARPRRILHQVASQLEQGFDFKHVTHTFLPQEMQSLLKSNLDDQVKARSVSDIMPALQMRSSHLQRLAVAIAIPLAAFLALNHFLWLAAKLIVPYYANVFNGFGVSLPAMTQLILDIGSAACSISWATFSMVAIASTSFLVLSTIIIASGWGHDLLAKIPWFGAKFKWSMQARVLRMMATLCRNGAKNGDIIKTSTQVSGFQSVKLQGNRLATAIEQGIQNWPIQGSLAGLPISLLKGTEAANGSTEQRVGIAATFEHLADMLERAAMTQAAVLATIIRWFVVSYAVMIVCITEIALLLPLIKLLNNLT